MRIGFDAKRFFHNDRGLGNYSRNLVYGISKYAPDHQCILYDAKAESNLVNESLLNSSSIQVKGPKTKSLSGSLWRTFKMAGDYLGDNLDVFHGLSMEIPRDFRRGGVPTVVTIHDLIFIKHPEFYSLPDRHIHKSKLNHAIKNSDKIIAISEQTKKDILEYLPQFEDKIQIVYQSCNEVFFERRSEEEKKDIKIKASLPNEYWLCVGALTENKNMMLVLETMSLMGKENCPPLVIVGKGNDYRIRLTNFARKAGLENHLHFVSDYLDPSPVQLSSIYQSSSLFLFPSFYEGFGIPILESRASLIPVVASNSTCLHEAGEDKISYFDPYSRESLKAAIEESTQQEPSLPMKFSLENSTNNLLEVYHQLT